MSIKGLYIGEITTQLNPDTLTVAVAPLFGAHRAQGKSQREALKSALEDLLWLEEQIPHIVAATRKAVAKNPL